MRDLETRVVELLAMRTNRGKLKRKSQGDEVT